MAFLFYTLHPKDNKEKESEKDSEKEKEVEEKKVNTRNQGCGSIFVLYESGILLWIHILNPDQCCGSEFK